MILILIIQNTNIKMTATLVVNDVIFDTDSSSSNARITTLETNAPNSVVMPKPSKSIWDANISSDVTYYNNRYIIDNSAVFIDADVEDIDKLYVVLPHITDTYSTRLCLVPRCMAWFDGPDSTTSGSVTVPFKGMLNFTSTASPALIWTGTVGVPDDVLNPTVYTYSNSRYGTYCLEGFRFGFRVNQLTKLHNCSVLFWNDRSDPALIPSSLLNAILITSTNSDKCTGVGFTILNGNELWVTPFEPLGAQSPAIAYKIWSDVTDPPGEVTITFEMDFIANKFRIYMGNDLLYNNTPNNLDNFTGNFGNYPSDGLIAADPYNGNESLFGNGHRHSLGFLMQTIGTEITVTTQSDRAYPKDTLFKSLIV